MRTISSFVAAALLAAATAACGGGSDDAEERRMEDAAKRHGVDADVELDEEGRVKSVEVAGPGGARSGMNVALPADYPRDVPIADDWSIISVAPIPQGGYLAQATSTQTMDELSARVSADFAAAGWTATVAETPVATMRSFGFEKDDRMAAVNLIGAGETVSIQIMTGSKM